jgi:2-polyprenyl-3-methyl-5-hydroxy-6-metoxy-1,4-benzoquinol methylase
MTSATMAATRRRSQVARSEVVEYSRRMTAAEFDQMYERRDPWQVVRKSVSNARRREVIESLAPLLNGKRVLEAGCGEGQLTPQIASHAREVMGIDISEVAISRAPNVQNATFLTASMTDFDFGGLMSY